MSELEDKLNSILSNPEMMSQIMSFAQSAGLGGESVQPTPTQAEPFPEIDIATLSKLSGLAQSAGVDNDQRNLLHALAPYLPKERIHKLEKAMRAAKMARLASGFLGQPGLLL